MRLVAFEEPLGLKVRSEFVLNHLPVSPLFDEDTGFSLNWNGIRVFGIDGRNALPKLRQLIV
jgi:hypothetical protein